MFEWLNDIIQALLKVFPRLIVVRSTHAGVVWRRGHQARAMQPGLHVIWPLVDEYEVIVKARQTSNLACQALVTADFHQIVVGGVVVFRVEDVLMAIGEANWDHTQTVCDIAQAAIVKVVTGWNRDDLFAQVAGEVELELTETCFEQLAEFGITVERCALTDLSPCRTIKLMSGHQPHHLG